MGCGNTANVDLDKNNMINQINNVKNTKNEQTQRSNNPKQKKEKDKMRQEMKEYQKIIKKNRTILSKSNNNDEDSDESEDSRLRSAKQRTKGLKKKELTREEIEEGIKQDKKEEEKRKGRKAYFSPMQKEVPFKHREPEEKYSPSSSKPYSIGYENEIYKDINYGKPIRLYDQTWLTYDCPVEPNNYGPQVQTPPGWRIPTLEDYKKLFKWVGDNEKIRVFLTHERLLNMKPAYQYITTDKVFELETNGYNSNAWTYFCIGFNFNDEVDYPGNERIDQTSKKDIKIIGSKKSNFLLNLLKPKKKYDDAIVSEGEDDFMKKMNKNLKKNEEDYKPLEPQDIKDKNRLLTPKFQENQISSNFKNENIVSNNNNNDKEKKDGEEGLNEDERPKKFVFAVNTHKHKETIRCKLIANEVLDMTFKCPLVVEAGYKSFFEVPKLANITTFKWNFNDQNAKEYYQTSDKLTASHVFKEAGEYNIELEIELFSNRIFHINRKILVIDEIEFGDEIIIDSVNYGQPIKLGNQIWLDRDLITAKNYEGKNINLKRGKGPGLHGENSYIESVCACPNGWRLPLKEEVEELIKFAGKNEEQIFYFFTALEGGFVANLDEGGFYDMVCLGFRNISKFEDYINDIKNGVYGKITSDIKFNKKEEEIEEIKKIFKDVGSDDVIDKKFLQKLKNYYNIILNNYNYFDIFNKEVSSLQIASNQVKMGFRTTSLTSPYTIFNTRCILDQKLDLDLGLKESNFPNNKEIDFALNYPNITSCSWDFGDKSEIVKDKYELKHKYKKPNIYEIKVKVTLFGRFNYEINKKIHIFKKNEETKLEKEDDIIIVPLGDYSHVEKTSEIHFRHSIAPISPFIDDNGFYISYHENSTKMLKLCQIFCTKGGEILKKYFETPLYEEEGGIPLDIVSTEGGCCLLVKDAREENNLYIEMVNHEGNLIWRNNIMQNGENPLKAKINQIKFYNYLTENIQYGTESMFLPYSGRLSYGNNKISCIFSYKNNFGGKYNNLAINSADIILLYNEDGTEVNLVYPWSTSHSLTQRMLFDGRYFISASLGDSEPHNIKVVRFEDKIPVHLGDYNPQSIIRIKNSKHIKEKHVSILEKKDEKNENINTEKSLVPEDKKKDEVKKEEEKKDATEISSKEKNSKDNEKNNSLLPLHDKDLNLQFYFPLQNKILNNVEMLNIEDDKTLLDSFHSQNFEFYRQREHLKMAARIPYITKDIIPGCIPGNFSGQSSGRMGGMNLLPNNKILLVYSRIECDNSSGSKNDKSELSCLFFNNDLNIENNVKLRQGNYINCIKNARYGDKIFIMISETTKVTDDKKYIYDKYNFHEREIEQDHLPCNCFLVNENGEIKSDLISFDFNFFSPNDDFQTLKDGSVVWNFVDDDNNLYLCFLACEETKNYLDRFKDDYMTAGKFNDFLLMKKEKEEENKKIEDKNFLKSIGIDEELMKKKILESELIEKERKAKELEKKREEEEEKRMEEEKRRKEVEEKEKMLKEIEQEEILRKKKEEEAKKQEGKKVEESSESAKEEEEKEDQSKLSNYFM